jgi:uncharacterized membrane-anchored protein
LVFLVSAAFVWIDENSGSVLINWFEYQIEFSTTFLLASLAFALLVLYVVIGIITGLFSIPSFLAKLFGTKEETKIKLLEKSFAALLATDYETADKASQKLLKVTENDPKFRKLALIAASKTAQEKGDYIRAQEQFTALADNSNLKFFAVRGLLQNSFQEGDIDSAIKHAEEAYKVNPDVKDGAQSVLDLYKKAGKWTEAERFVKANSKSFWLGQRAGFDEKKELAEIKFLHARELLLTADGRKGYIDLAIDNLVQAVELVPTHEEAITILIKLCIESNRLDDAKHAVENFWKYKTNIEIGKKYVEVLAISNPEKKEQQERKAAKKLYKINNKSEVSRNLLLQYS